jgi:GNAT superfamily N-acetyltransferase
VREREAKAVVVERESRVRAEDALRFREIYEESFPRSERDETADVVASIAAGTRQYFVARVDGGLAGIAVVFVLRGPSVAFLEYLAVAEERRNAGLGGALLDHLLGAGALGDIRGIVFEVERPEDAVGAERLLRERRIAFYRRHGASLVDGAPSYRAPNLEYAGVTEPYSLMWIPARGEDSAQLRGDLLRRTVESILTESYELGRGDPLVLEVLDGLGR